MQSIYFGCGQKAIEASIADNVPLPDGVVAQPVQETCSATLEPAPTVAQPATIIEQKPLNKWIMPTAPTSSDADYCRGIVEEWKAARRRDET